MRARDISVGLNHGASLFMSELKDGYFPSERASIRVYASADDGPHLQIRWRNGSGRQEDFISARITDAEIDELVEALTVIKAYRGFRKAKAAQMGGVN